MSVLKFGVVAPVAAGVTADPGWMVAFARYLEACGFGSIIAVEPTVMATRYDSVYPYDRSGRVELAADCPIPTRLTCCRLWPAIPPGSGWPPEFWCCPTIIRFCWPNARRRSMRCPAGGFGCASASAGYGKRWSMRHRIRNSRAPQQRAVGGVRALWDDRREGVTHHGEFFQFDGVVCSPKSVAGRHLPIHIGCHSKAAARRAGRFGDGFQPLGVTGAQLDDLLTLMHDVAAAAGRSPADIEVSLGHSATKIDAERAGAPLTFALVVIRIVVIRIEPKSRRRCPQSVFGSGMPSLVENSASLWVDSPSDTRVRGKKTSVR